jgi:hypothetical protein
MLVLVRMPSGKIRGEEGKRGEYEWKHAAWGG